ncbi:MAG TPA: hypothetical protein ENJ18_14355, partial [Nannocystis exedens]|nr:hypothetical protein [Nannocystis exedens]
MSCLRRITGPGCGPLRGLLAALVILSLPSAEAHAGSPTYARYRDRDGIVHVVGVAGGKASWE